MYGRVLTYRGRDDKYAEGKSRARKKKHPRTGADVVPARRYSAARGPSVRGRVRHVVARPRRRRRVKNVFRRVERRKSIFTPTGAQRRRPWAVDFFVHFLFFSLDDTSSGKKNAFATRARRRRRLLETVRERLERARPKLKKN